MLNLPVPYIMSEQVRNTLQKIKSPLIDRWEKVFERSFGTYPGKYRQPHDRALRNWEKLMSAPTYRYNPFKLKEPKKIPVPTWDKVHKKAVTKWIDNPKYKPK
jgi:hypothetical protein